MLAITLPNDIEERLAHMAKVTGRTKTYYAREAILNYLEDLEDKYLSLSILEKPNKRHSQQEVEEKLGLAD
jgi:RHH-type rel operon transcriptional repressor/antitoxin RelB